MSPTQISWLLGAMVGLGVLVTVGWAASAVIYRRLGYPPTPKWVRAIRLADDMEAIAPAIDAALANGFEIRSQDSKRLVLERTFESPPCRMTVEIGREAWRWQKLSVRCDGRRWLNWSSFVGTNSYYRPWRGK